MMEVVAEHCGWCLGTTFCHGVQQLVVDEIAGLRARHRGSAGLGFVLAVCCRGAWFRGGLVPARSGGWVGGGDSGV